jgi:uncharacterized protein YrrD
MDSKVLELLLTNEERASKEIELIINKLKERFKSFKITKKGEPNKFKLLNIKELEDLMAKAIAIELESKELAFVMFNSIYFTRDNYKELLNNKEIELSDMVISLKEDN